VSDAKADSSKAKPSGEQKAAAAADRRRRKAGELQERRSAKLQAAETIVRQAGDALGVVRERIRRRESLADHLQTFYGEVDKLAKGNRQIEATALTVEQANEIIRDAKAVVTGDVYLDRVKEFVPAGENPVYPDVLMVAATVQAAVRRAEPVLAGEEARLHETWHNARTIAAAARLILESGEQPLKTEVEDALGEKPATQWFYKADDDCVYFKIDRFDDAEVERLLGTTAEQ
jgi:hypothetical protein